MSDLPPSSLRELFPDWTWNDRTVAWLWLMVKKMHPRRFQLRDYGANDMGEQIAKVICDKGLIEHLAEAKRLIVLPDHELTWIEKKGRQINWLLFQIGKDREIPIPECPRHLTPRDRLIVLLDFWPDDIHHKVSKLHRLQHDWSNHVADDRRYAWFQSEKEKQRCQLAWNWYLENHPAEIKGVARFDNLDSLLTFLDTTPFYPDEKRFHVDEIKRVAKLQQSKANLIGKKQTNLGLKDEIRIQLEVLAQREKCSLVQIAERLIEHAYHHGVPAMATPGTSIPLEAVTRDEGNFTLEHAEENAEPHQKLLSDVRTNYR